MLRWQSCKGRERALPCSLHAAGCAFSLLLCPSSSHPFSSLPSPRYLQLLRSTLAGRRGPVLPAQSCAALQAFQSCGSAGHHGARLYNILPAHPAPRTPSPTHMPTMCNGAHTHWDTHPALKRTGVSMFNQAHTLKSTRECMHRRCGGVPAPRAAGRNLHRGGGRGCRARGACVGPSRHLHQQHRWRQQQRRRRQQRRADAAAGGWRQWCWLSALHCLVW